MKFSNTFRLDAELATAWALLRDVERLAPLMPGAELTSFREDEFEGVFRVKIGPVVAQYDATAKFAELDETQHVAVLQASGRDTRGQGNFSTELTCTLEPDGAATNITVDTDLTITGKAAQFGSGIVQDVGVKVLGTFVENIARELSAPKPAGHLGAAAAAPAQPASPIDVSSMATGAVIKRAAVPAAVGLALVLAWLLGRRR